jgi:hypothetical protein
VAEHLCEGEPFEAWYRQNGLKVGFSPQQIERDLEERRTRTRPYLTVVNGGHGRDVTTGGKTFRQGAPNAPYVRYGRAT